MTLFENNVSTEAIMLKWSHQRVLIHYNLCPNKRGNMVIDMNLVKTEDWCDASISQDCQRMQANRQKLGGGKEGVPTVFRRSKALPTSWFWTSSLQNCETMKFYCFKPPSLWYFVLAALANQYIILFHFHNHSMGEMLFFSLLFYRCGNWGSEK